MSEDDCKALFSKLKMLCRAYTQDDPENKVKEKAWMQLVKEFIHVEMKDPLELLNTFMIVKNPLLEAKLAIFESKHFMVFFLSDRDEWFLESIPFPFRLRHALWRGGKHMSSATRVIPAKEKRVQTLDARAKAVMLKIGKTSEAAKKALEHYDKTASNKKKDHAWNPPQDEAGAQVIMNDGWRKTMPSSREIRASSRRKTTRCSASRTTACSFLCRRAPHSGPRS
jgi:hypothetical protein